MQVKECAKPYFFAETIEYVPLENQMGIFPQVDYSISHFSEELTRSIVFFQLKI